MPLGPSRSCSLVDFGQYMFGIFFYKVTTGICNAGEMRVAHYFGRDEPELARLAGYKALLLSMLVASVVSILFFLLQNSIPKWFTVDETLQGMLREVVPYIGVGNLTM